MACRPGHTLRPYNRASDSMASTRVALDAHVRPEAMAITYMRHLIR